MGEGDLECPEVLKMRKPSGPEEGFPRLPADDPIWALEKAAIPLTLSAAAFQLCSVFLIVLLLCYKFH